MLSRDEIGRQLEPDASNANRSTPAPCDDGRVQHALDLRGLRGVDLVRVTDVLRAAGARFGFVHGSRAAGRVRRGSDLDVAAWFAAAPPDLWSLELPDSVDLVALDRLPLAVAGRIALHGVLLFDDDPPARVRWQAETRLRYLDEAWRRATATADFLAAHAHG